MASATRGSGGTATLAYEQGRRRPRRNRPLPQRPPAAGSARPWRKSTSAGAVEQRRRHDECGSSWRSGPDAGTRPVTTARRPGSIFDLGRSASIRSWICTRLVVPGPPRGQPGGDADALAGLAPAELDDAPGGVGDQRLGGLVAAHRGGLHAPHQPAAAHRLFTGRERVDRRGRAVRRYETSGAPGERGDHERVEAQLARGDAEVVGDRVGGVGVGHGARASRSSPRRERSPRPARRRRPSSRSPRPGRRRRRSPGRASRRRSRRGSRWRHRRPRRGWGARR